MAGRERRAQKAKPGRTLARSALPGIRPEVIVELLFDRGLFFVSVHNIGNRPAVTISVTFNEKLFGLNGTREISSQALFRNIEFLGPGREIVTFLDRSSSYFSDRRPTKLMATVSYSDPEGQRYEATIKHDLEIYRELIFLETSELGAEGADSVSSRSGRCDRDGSAR